PTTSQNSCRVTARWLSSRSRRSERERRLSPPLQSDSCSGDRLGRQLAPDRRVVRGPLLASRFLVNVTRRNPARRVRRQQQMIDAQPFGAVPAAGLVVPKGVAVRLPVEDAVGIGQSEIDETAKPRSRLGPAQRVVTKRYGVVNVIVGRADVVVS